MFFGLNYPQAVNQRRGDMKVYLTTAIALLLCAASPCIAQDSFQRGFQQGYQAENPDSITPIAPIPSIPAPGQGYYEEGIKEGAEQGQEDQGQDYQSGYDQGQQDQQDDDSSSTDDSGGGDDN
jgi:hypothetical protein